VHADLAGLARARKLYVIGDCRPLFAELVRGIPIVQRTAASRADYGGELTEVVMPLGDEVQTLEISLVALAK